MQQEQSDISRNSSCSIMLSTTFHVILRKFGLQCVVIRQTTFFPRNGCWECCVGNWVCMEISLTLIHPASCGSYRPTVKTDLSHLKTNKVNNYLISLALESVEPSEVQNFIGHIMSPEAVSVHYTLYNVLKTIGPTAELFTKHEILQNNYKNLWTFS